ncbi:MAG: signal peptide peptidase SppA, partial [Deltaproteobacteria bacterium]|nr:signal peptide peptidase SppA [Deltaproteobacteria bacterium]
NFPEVFNRTSPSQETVEMLNSLLNSLADLFNAALEKRKSVKAMKELFAESPYTPSQGIAAGIIDGYCPWNRVVEEINEMEPGRFHYHHNYWNVKRRDESFGMRPVVAVVAIEGDLVDGESAHLPFLGIKLAGSSDIVNDLSATASSPNVAAIILRIDSGGGSMTAAETVFHAVKEIAARKPVVAVIGNTGASGAYYIANAANRIFLQDSTITGSIGVWGGKFSLKGLYEKIGVNREAIKIGEHSDMDSPDREYTKEEIEVLKEKLKYLYDLFIKRVQEGRGLDKAAVEHAAEGMVFTGKKALELKLADQRGGLFEALEYFRDVIPDHERMVLKIYPEKGLMEKLLEDFKGTGFGAPGAIDSAGIILKHMAGLGGNPLVWMPFKIY